MVRDLPFEVSATLSILGETPSPDVTVSIVSIAEGVLRLADVPPVPLCSPVKVTQDDCVWLGEVTAFHPRGEATIRVLHFLGNVSELLRLAARFTGRQPVEVQTEPTLS